MANNRNHPVHTSYLVKSLRVRLMPKISRKEWNELLKNLRGVYEGLNDHQKDILRTSDHLGQAFFWAETPQGQEYWLHFDNITFQ